MKKENKKTSKMKKVLIGSGVLLMIGSCGAMISDEEPEESTGEEVAVEESEEMAEMREEQAKQQEAHDKREAEKQAEEATEEESTEEVTEETVEEETVEEVTQEEQEKQFLSILNENMAGFADVKFISETDTYRFIPTDPAMKDAIEMIAQGYMHDEFMELQYSMETLSSTAVDKLGEGYSFTLVNPHNTERELIVVVDGVTLYNAVTEMQQ